MTYCIRAHRRGSSMFGAATSLCKGIDGKVMTFETLTEAQQQVSVYNGYGSFNVWYEVVTADEAADL